MSSRGSEPAPEVILESLASVLEARKDADPEQSYVAELYRDGLDRILRKVGEEAAETLLAAKDDKPEAVIHEVADLWFHTLILLAYQGLSAGDVTAELARRFGVSGLTEKAGRRAGP